MVNLDTAKCAYCGGCVSVCPVDALTLAETRLSIDETCIDCGNCVLACPVGALSAEEQPRPRAMNTLRRGYDVVVVGAGPGGSTAAEFAARAGLSVLLLEKRQEIGSPVRCAEGVGSEPLTAFLAPDPRWIAAEIHQAEITTVAGGVRQTQRAAGGTGYILERRVFDRVLAERAARAGATVRVKTAVTGVLLDGGRVCGVRIARGDFAGHAGEMDIAAQVVIAADGVESQVGRWAGLDVQMPLGDAMACAQYLLAGIDIDPTCTCYTIGYDIAPGGYAWIFPKGDGCANVGLGIQGDLSQDQARGKPGTPGTALAYLDRFIESQPSLACGSPVSLIPGNVPVAQPPPRLVTHGLMLVGDAARQVDPLTGGGIINAMTAGRLAGEVAAAAVAARDVSASFLGRYEDAWQNTIGRKMQRNYRLRGRFAPEQRTDERFVQAFMLATK
jgi:digeranylgeranylglycerophospholipid reductase